MQEKNVNPSHSFDLVDVERYGSIEKALLIKEIRGMQAYKLRTSKDDWVHYSAQALEAKFPYMARRSIQRWLVELVKDGYLQTRIKNKMRYDRTASYRLPDLSTVGQNDQYTLDKMANGIGQNGQPIPSHSTSLSTSQSKPQESNKFDWKQKRSYALACRADEAQAERARAARHRKGSTKSLEELFLAVRAEVA